MPTLKREPGFIAGEQFVYASQVISKKLDGCMDFTDAYTALWCEVIKQAVRDLWAASGRVADDAERFIFTNRLDPVADAAGIDPGYVRHVVMTVTESALAQA